MILLIIKGISTALVYHRRWEPRAHYFTMIQVYNYHPHTQTHTYTNTHTCKVFSSNCYINSFFFFFKAASTLHWGIFYWMVKMPTFTLTYWFSQMLRPLTLSTQAWVSKSMASTRMVRVVRTLLALTLPVAVSVVTFLQQQLHSLSLLPSTYTVSVNNNFLVLIYFSVLTQPVYLSLQ